MKLDALRWNTTISRVETVRKERGQVIVSNGLPNLDGLYYVEMLPSVRLVVQSLQGSCRSALIHFAGIGAHFGKGWTELPGGKIDSGETIQDTVERELKEEVGVEESRLIQMKRLLGAIVELRRPEKDPLKPHYDPYRWPHRIKVCVGFHVKINADLSQCRPQFAVTETSRPDFRPQRVLYPSVDAAVAALRGPSDKTRTERERRIAGWIYGS